jgi:hypothetical protein
MFAMRMKREGRYEEFQSALAEVIKERSATGAVVDTTICHHRGDAEDGLPG